MECESSALPALSPSELSRLTAHTFVAEVEYHEVIGSTNDRAKELAERGPVRLPVLVIAQRQTAGRGRGENRWWTGPGSLALSVLLDLRRFGVGTIHTPLVSLAAGIAVAEAVRACVPHFPLGLHWPNDVYLAGGKLAGILVESTAGGLHVLGIGINANNTAAQAPAELHSRVATLRDISGRYHDPAAILHRLLQGLETWLGRLGKMPHQVGRQANELCLQRGRLVCLRHLEGTAEGVCAGIAADGALVLQTRGGQQAFYAGSVVEMARGLENPGSDQAGSMKGKERGANPPDCGHGRLAPQ